MERRASAARPAVVPEGWVVEMITDSIIHHVDVKYVYFCEHLAAASKTPATTLTPTRQPLGRLSNPTSGRGSVV